MDEKVSLDNGMMAVFSDVFSEWIEKQSPELFSKIYEYVSLYSLSRHEFEFIVKPSGMTFGFLKDIDSVRESLQAEARKYLCSRFQQTDALGAGNITRFSIEHLVDGADPVHIAGLFAKKDEDGIYACFNIKPGNVPQFDLVFGSRRNLFTSLGLSDDSVLIDYDIPNNLTVIMTHRGGEYREEIIDDMLPGRIADMYIDAGSYRTFFEAVNEALLNDPDTRPVKLLIKGMGDGNREYSASFNTVRNSSGRVLKMFVILTTDNRADKVSVIDQYRDTVSKVSNIVMEAAYDMTDGRRLSELSTRIPDAFGKADTVSGLFSSFVGELTADGAKEAVMNLGQMISPDNPLMTDTGQASDFNMLMRNQSGAGDPRWYKLRYVYFVNRTDSHRILCFNLIDINNEYALMNEAINQSLTDYFTGLPNRAGFMKYVEKMHNGRNDIIRKGLSAFLLLEPDDQRTLRIEYSLEVSDSYLRRMADSMRPCMGKDDFLAKLGDYTFLFVLHDIKSLYELNRKVKEIKNASVISTGGTATLATSIGGVLLRGDDRDDYRRAYETALQALSDAQDEGGDRIKLVGINEPDKKPSVISDAEPALKPLKDVYIRTFGFFEVFVDGVPLSFKSAKAKELLAILVDRKGGLVSSREAVSLMWENEESNEVTLARFRKVAMRLNRELEAAGIENIVEVIDHKRRLNVRTVKCDLFEYLNGNPEYAKLFDGNYMLNYSWGEYTLSNL